MARYPVSVARGKLSERFDELLTLHVASGSKILDPTCGSKLLWGDPPPLRWDVTYSDIADGGVDVFRLGEERPEWLEAFDAVVFDLPYFFGVSGSSDPREGAYGGYDQEFAQLKEFMTIGLANVIQAVRPGGKVIVKCSDQYHVASRQWFGHHFRWASNMERLGVPVIDLFIYHHSRTSPTAFQVKARPCCVIVHSYFLIGVKGE